MTQEEKAKAYDKTIERAKKVLLDCTSEEQKVVEYITPELKESEGERIRKWLIELVEEVRKANPTNVEYNGMCGEAIVWLEKQGKNSMGISEATKQKLEDSLNKALEKETSESCNEFLDEQSEQKTIEEYNITGVGSKNAQGKLGEMIKNLKPINEVLEQKPADKVEPQFKVGDWITNGHATCQITFIDSRYWYSKTCVLGNVIDIDKTFHLWTIKDAKDGDVLCCESGWTCIFKALDNYTNTFSSYSFMDKTGWFCETGSEAHTLEKTFIKAYNGNIFPATKEQRDLLFQKMKEAGYIWDSENKKLKGEEVDNIHNYLYSEQSPAWSEEDKEMYKKVETAIDSYYAPFSTDAEEMSNWLKSLKGIVQPQKQEWSEKDKCMLNNVIDTLKPLSQTTHSGYAINSMIDWLKSLRPQNWTKEDKERYKSCLQRLSTGNPEQPETINSKWFKEHVYSQATWKPSDEQIKALSYYIENYVDNDGVFGRQLVKLYHDLLILRKE